jgi:hypothetical protein
MAKELPYYQFEVAEYLAGDIMVCSLEAQGLFSIIKCLYWQKECVLTIRQIKRRHDREDLINELIDEGCIKVDDNDCVSISFLNNQFESFHNKRKKLSEAGKKGGLNKKNKATLKPPLENEEATLKPPSSIKNRVEENRVEDIREEDNNINTIPKKPPVLFEEKHKAFSLRFYEQLKNQNLILKTQNPDSKSWIDPIKLLETKDKLEWDKIRKAANYYFENIEDEFMPVIRSTKAFRDKFEKIVDHFNRNQKN